MAEKRIVPGVKGEYKSLDEALDEVDNAMFRKGFYGGIVYFETPDVDCSGNGLGVGCFILLAHIPTEGINAATLNMAARCKSVLFGPAYDRINILKCNGLLEERDGKYYVTKKVWDLKYACEFDVMADASHA